MWRAVAVEPTKADGPNGGMVNESVRRLLAAVNQLHNPRGKPAAASRRKSFWEVSGTRSEGFRMKQLPVAKA